MEENFTSENLGLKINQEAVGYLRESAKWSLFLAIMGFIGIAFMLLMAIFMSSALGEIANKSPGLGGMMTGWLSWFYVILGIIYFFPVFYMYKYAADMRQALQVQNEEMMTKAFGYLKSHHKFLGISVIAIIVLWIIMVIGFIAFFANSARL